MVRPAFIHDTSGSRGGPWSDAPSRFARGWLVVLAALQFAVFAASHDATLRSAMLAGAAAGAALAAAPLTRAALPGVALLSLAGAVPIFIRATAPFEPGVLRLPLAALLYGCLLLASSALVTLTWPRAGRRLFAAALGVWVVAVAGDTALAALADARTPPRGPVWIGGPVADADLGRRYPPGGRAWSLHAADARDYFRPEERASDRWTPLGDRSPGGRTPPPMPDAPDGITRLTIAGPVGGGSERTAWAFRGVDLLGGGRYVVGFRARADRPRRVMTTLLMDHAPWSFLGYSRALELDTTWRTFADDFTATATDRRGEVTFDLGTEPGTVEIASLEIRRVATTASAITDTARGYAVEYRFNDNGCRGETVPAREPSDARRILVLGGDTALGVGVREQDTFPARLQERLREGTDGPTATVINCGVSGFTLQQDRRWFDWLAPRYQPDLALVTMTDTDAAWAPDAIRRFAHIRRPFERFSPLWGGVQFLRHEWRLPEPDFGAAIAGLRQLRASAAKLGIPVAVVVFRTAPLDQGRWQPLQAALASAAATDDLAWIDIGDALLRSHASSDLTAGPTDLRPNALAHQEAAMHVASWLLTERALR